MSPSTCIKFCILSICFWSLMWIHLPILESDCQHLAAYTWLNASHWILQTWAEIGVRFWSSSTWWGGWWWGICKYIALQCSQAIAIFQGAAAFAQDSSSLSHIITSARSSVTDLWQTMICDYDQACLWLPIVPNHEVKTVFWFQIFFVIVDLHFIAMGPICIGFFHYFSLIAYFRFFFGLCLVMLSFALYFWWMGSVLDF